MNFDQGNDLLSLHYDHAPDKDDGHATVTGKVLVDTYGVNHVVVGGAHGKNEDSYNPASESVMDATWGANNWINAHNNRQLAIQELGEKWLTTIQNGGRVFVAEGGQADTSLGAAKYVLNNGGDPSQIKIVQHSQWNIDQYGDGVLDALIDLGVEHIKIDDGNRSNNTADLNTTNSSVSNFVDTALNSPWSSAWEAAFDYLPQSNKLDFSDTVEALHILGVSSEEVADPIDFANLFLDEAPSNDAPVAEDDKVSTEPGNPLTFSVLSNDSDPDQDSLSIDSFDDSQTQGLVTQNSDGTFTYNPNGEFSNLNAGETDSDSFTYTVSDEKGKTDSAIATITVEGTEDDQNANNVVAAINAGGPALTQAGIDFASDAFFQNGNSFTDNDIGNGSQPEFDGTVYETERYGTPLNYEIPVDATGSYTVELYFAEIYWNNAGDRVFDVTVEGEKVWDNLDLLAETEGDIEQPVVFQVPEAVSPESFGAADAIDIDFSTEVDNATISGLVVRSAEEVTDEITGPIEVGLYNAESNRLIENIQDGKTIDGSNLENQNLTIAASVSDSSLQGQVESMALNLNNEQATQIENVEPYALFGDINGDFLSGSGIPQGNNTISFELYSQNEANGDLLETVTMDFEII
ncbi:MAG: malectin domain-containing carbohydrate-binding protein [Halothece sp.]